MTTVFTWIAHHRHTHGLAFVAGLLGYVTGLGFATLGFATMETALGTSGSSLIVQLAACVAAAEAASVLLGLDRPLTWRLDLVAVVVGVLGFAGLLWWVGHDPLAVLVNGIVVVLAVGIVAERSGFSPADASPDASRGSRDPA